MSADQLYDERVDKSVKALEGDEAGSSPNRIPPHKLHPLSEPSLYRHRRKEPTMARPTQVSISRPENAVAISIKHEGEDRGHAFGPALWIDDKGNVVANVIDSTMEHFLKTIDTDGNEVEMPKYMPAWMDFREVYKVAGHFGVKVEEV